MATALDTVLAFLQGKGLSSAQAAGVAGNWTVESGLRPDAYNAREGAIGLAQWEGGRRAALDRYAAANGAPETDLATQLNFAWSEFQGSESGALQRLLQTNDPGTAAAVVDQYYERSAGTSRSTRIADAQAIAAGRPTTTGTATSGGGGLAVQNAGLLTPSMDDVGRLVMKAGAALVAAALVVIGVKETVRGQGS